MEYLIQEMFLNFTKQKTMKEYIWWVNKSVKKEDQH